MTRKIAIIGALTSFGLALSDCLAAAGWAANDIYALSPTPKRGIRIPFQNSFLPILSLETFDFHQVSLAFLCLPAFLSEYKDDILQSGTYLIDCVGILENAPCIISSLNLKRAKTTHAVSNPTALTVALARTLAPIHQQFQITGAEATIFLSAGLFGTQAVQDLLNQSRCLYTHEEPQTNFFPKIQAFNLLPNFCPALGRRTSDQIKSLLHFPMTISTCLTPVFQGECYSVTLTTQRKSTLSQIKKICYENTLCRLDESFAPNLGLTTQDILCGNSVYLSQLVSVPFRPNTYHLWILCDSLRNGSVPNAVQIADYLLS